MNEQSITGLWVYLSTRPLLGLTMTLLAYVLAWRIHQRLKSHPLANPVLIAVALLVLVLSLLGPATVALAIPLYRQFHRMRAMALPLGVTLLIGSSVAICSAWIVGAWLGADDATLISLAPKSVTTPIAMAVAEALGGLPSLTAALVIATGILGAMTAQGLFRLMRIRDSAAQGFAIGIAAHGIGTARAFQLSPEAGAFAALAMAANGLLTALLAPWLVPMLQHWLAR